MLSLTTCLLLSTTDEDSYAKYRVHPVPNFQYYLLERFFAKLPDTSTFAFGKGSKKYLEWKGVTSLNGIVTAIRYTDYQYGEFDLPYLPPTIEQLHIFRCFTYSTLDTRMLPRRLTHLHMYTNWMIGSLALESLPWTLIECLLYENNFSGTISLTNLPPTLHVLDVSRNCIEQDVVLYSTFQRISCR